jgi:hypothetical protein
MTDDRYRSPLATRYASPAMQRLWGEPYRIGMWRRVWLALAESERELGLDISEAALAEMRAHLDDVDLAAAAAYEKRFRHDVMAHVHQFGDQAPAAKPIIHLGATSAFVTDNADVLVVREGLRILLGRLLATLARLEQFARTHAALPCLAYTHFQPAQLTTVGKRATLWMQDLALDVEELVHRLETLRLRGCKGTTGTQASFLELFKGDHARSASWSGASPASLASRGSTPSPARPTAARGTAWCWTPSRESPSPPPRWRPTSGCCSTRENCWSRSRRTRSARAPWRTSATRCGPSGSAGWRGSS